MHSTTLSASFRGSRIARRVGRASLGLVAVAAIGVGAAQAGAAEPAHHTDVITFTSYVHLTPPQSEGARFILLGDTCWLQADDKPAVPCMIYGAGTVAAVNGTAHGIITSERGKIDIDEVYSFTSPTTLTATGTATEVLTGAHGDRVTGTFVGDFSAVPTDRADVLLDWGTITITH
jgi:hypothetical protein